LLREWLQRQRRRDLDIELLGSPNQLRQFAAWSIAASNPLIHF
jgi:hypothetical protein